MCIGYRAFVQSWARRNHFNMPKCVTDKMVAGLKRIDDYRAQTHADYMTEHEADEQMWQLYAAHHADNVTASNNASNHRLT